MASTTTIIYYSWFGNTEAIANEIQTQTGYDIIKIQEKKERKNRRIMMAASAAWLGLKSRLKPMDFQLKGTDRIILGVQVWAGKTAPAINKFLTNADFKGKKVWLFITKADEKVPQKVIDSITNRIEIKGGTVIDSISFTTVIDRVISVEKIRDELKAWLKKNDLNLTY